MERNVSLIQKAYEEKVSIIRQLLKCLDKRKDFFEVSKKLNDLYSNKELKNAFLRLFKIFENDKKIPESKVLFLDYLYQVTSDLYQEYTEQIEFVKRIVNDVSSRGVPETELVLRFRNSLNKEGVFITKERNILATDEDIVLGRIEPGAEAGGYIHLFEAVKKGIIGIKNKCFIHDNKIIQGVTLCKDGLVRIKGNHFSEQDKVKRIKRDLEFIPSIEDPYTYIVEKGKLEHSNQREIQKFLGIHSAEAFIGLDVRVFPEQLFIKIHGNDPVKFAIQNIKSSQINHFGDVNLVAA